MATKRASRTIAARINKLSGQLTAVNRMVSGRRSCVEILAQIEAVRSGLASVAAILLNEELARLARKRHIDPHDILSLTKTFIGKT
ncbi:MAG: metal-sensing transcriptional repressor [Candidatus Kerfeldbacteria bacterium]